jgi:hypothetical protein
MERKRTTRQNQGNSTSRQPFFKFYADDWIAGTLELSFEERGFYIAVLAAVWAKRKPIPADHLPLALRCDPRQAKRLLARLIDLGKLTLDASNCVYNSRLMAQLCEATPAELPADFAETSPELLPNFSEKLGNIFPERQAKTTKPRARARLPEPEPEPEREKDTKLATTSAVAASGPEIVGLNGSTTTIVETVARWTNQLSPDRDTARRIITSHVGIFGSNAVRRGVADLDTDVATGKLVGNPLKAFTGYCDRAKKHENSVNGGSHAADRSITVSGPRSGLSKSERARRAIEESMRELGFAADR